MVIDSVSTLFRINTCVCVCVCTYIYIYIYDDCSISTDDCRLKLQSLRHLFIIGFNWCKLVPHLHHSLGFKNYDPVTSRHKMTGSYFSCRFYIGVFLLLYKLPSLWLKSPVCPIEESLFRARFQPGIFLFSQYGNSPKYQREANRCYTLPKGDLELCKAGVFNSLRYYVYPHTLYIYRGCPCGVMVKAMDCRIVVSEFVFQLHYYVHFWANTLGKGMNPLILPAMG